MRPAAPTVLALVLAFAISGCGLDYLALLGMGPRETRVVRVAGATIDVEVGHRNLRHSSDTVASWVRRDAWILADYCGGFPIDGLSVRVVSGVPGRVWFGQHWYGERVAVLVGGGTSEHDLETDSILLHELAHAAFPSMEREYRWMREGLSTYLESILRTHVGVIDGESVWALWVRVMPRGLPSPDGGGLDHSGGISRVYWGGALFWLLVDVEVRERTHNTRSVRDILRQAHLEGGDSRHVWSIERVSAMAERATGTQVFAERYEAMGPVRGDVDLPALWRRLGVQDGVPFDEDAPLAHVRRELTGRHGGQPPALR